MATYTNQLLVLVGGTIKKISAADTIAIGGNMDIGGNLTVTGTITSGGTINATSHDQYIDLAIGQSSTTAKPGGTTVTSKRSSTNTYTTVSFTAGVGPAVSAPTIVVSGDASADILVDDILEVSGASVSANDGLYLVKTVTYSAPNTTIELYGTGSGSAVPSYMLFIQSQVTTSVDATATTFRPYLTVLTATDGIAIEDSTPAAIPLGRFAYAAGSTKSAFFQTWVDLAASGPAVTLQSAYQNGNTITMTTADGSFNVQVGGGQSAGVSLAGNTNSDFSVTGADLDLKTVTSGALNLTSAGALPVAAAGAVSVNSSGSSIGVGNVAATGAVNIGTAGNRTTTVGAQGGSSTLALKAGSGGATLASDGTLVVTSTGTSSVTNDTGDLTVATTTSGSILVDGRDGVEVNSAAGALKIGNDVATGAIDIGTAGNRAIQVGVQGGSTSVAIKAGSTGMTIDSDDGISVDAGAASNFTTSAGNLTVQASAGTLLLNGNGAGGVDIESTSGPLQVGANNVAQNVNIGTAGARAIQVGSASAASLDLIAGAGGVDITAGGNSTVGVTGTYAIDSTGNMEINASAGTIGIGNHNDPHNINIGTGSAARTITVGNATGATAVQVNTGTGGFGVTTASTGAVLISATAADATLQSTTSGDVKLVSANDVILDAAAGKNIRTQDDVLFAASGGVEVSVAAGVGQGDILFVDSSGVAQLAQNDVTTDYEIDGVALEANGGGSPATKRVATVYGTTVYVNFTAAPSAGDIAYLSATPGQAQNTAPATGRIYRLGKVLSGVASGGRYLVLFKPQYIADN